MMELIPWEIQKKLQENWGDKSTAMQCFCECRLYDESTKWEWFIYAQNPQDFDGLIAIENTNVINPFCILSYSLLKEIFNFNGENILYDLSYRRRLAEAQYKLIKEANKWKLIDTQ